MENINILVEKIMKTAGMKTTLTGSIIGTGVGSMMGSSKAEKNPNSSVEDKALTIGTNTAGGAVLGGVGASLGSKGLKGIKSVGSKAVGLMKKSEIEVPESDEEKSEARKEVLESPNPEEIKKINNSICDKKQEMKDRIEKAANLYMKETICENCGFEGRMNSADGRCPKCESMSGVKLKEVPTNTVPENIESREQRRGRLYDEINNAKRDEASYY